MQLVLDLPDADAQDLGGPARGPAMALERGQDRVPFDVGHGRARNGWRRRLAVGGAELGGQVVLLDGVALRQHHRALDDVLELTDVARPVVGDDLRQRAVAEAFHALAVLPGKALQEMRGERRHVALPTPQRGQRDVDHVEPIVQILAEFSLRDQLLQVAVRRGDEADVHGLGLVAAHALELPLLEHSKQLHLSRWGDVADLVQEQGAGVGLLEPALAAPIRARVRAAFVAKELALEQRLGQGSAVQPDEWPVFPR